MKLLPFDIVRKKKGDLWTEYKIAIADGINRRTTVLVTKGGAP